MFMTSLWCIICRFKNMDESLLWWYINTTWIVYVFSLHVWHLSYERLLKKKLKKTLGSEEYQMVSWQLKSSGLWKTAIFKNLLPLVISPSRQTAAKASSSFCHSALLKTEWNFLYFFLDWHKGMVFFSVSCYHIHFENGCIGEVILT